jgi:hypothetical protein
MARASNKDLLVVEQGSQQVTGTRRVFASARMRAQAHTGEVG